MDLHQFDPKFQSALKFKIAENWDSNSGPEIKKLIRRIQEGDRGDSKTHCSPPHSSFVADHKDPPVVVGDQRSVDTQKDEPSSFAAAFDSTETTSLYRTPVQDLMMEVEEERRNRKNRSKSRNRSQEGDNNEGGKGTFRVAEDQQREDSNDLAQNELNPDIDFNSWTCQSMQRVKPGSPTLADMDGHYVNQAAVTGTYSSESKDRLTNRKTRNRPAVEAGQKGQKIRRPKKQTVETSKASSRSKNSRLSGSQERNSDPEATGQKRRTSKTNRAVPVGRKGSRSSLGSNESRRRRRSEQHVQFDSPQEHRVSSEQKAARAKSAARAQPNRQPKKPMKQPIAEQDTNQSSNHGRNEAGAADKRSSSKSSGIDVISGRRMNQFDEADDVVFNTDIYGQLISLQQESHHLQKSQNQLNEEIEKLTKLIAQGTLERKQAKEIAARLKSELSEEPNFEAEDGQENDQPGHPQHPPQHPQQQQQPEEPDEGVYDQETEHGKEDYQPLEELDHDVRPETPSIVVKNEDNDSEGTVPHFMNQDKERERVNYKPKPPPVADEHNVPGQVHQISSTPSSKRPRSQNTQRKNVPAVKKKQQTVGVKTIPVPDRSTYVSANTPRGQSVRGQEGTQRSGKRSRTLGSDRKNTSIKSGPLSASTNSKSGSKGSLNRNRQKGAPK